MRQVYRLALLGDPVAHSRSPAIQAAALRLSGLTGEYKAITADREILSKTIDDLRSGVLNGINVTMPLKSSAFELADKLTPEGRLAGSVNILRLEGGAIEGHSTDVVAFREIFEEDDFKKLDNVLILGAGGSAAAGVVAAEDRNVYLSARTASKAQALAGAFEVAGVIPWGSGVANALVVNATPLGMSGERLPGGIVELAAALVDLPYADVGTNASAEAIDLGIPTADGFEFLARQASASFRWWTGENVDFGVLAEIARNV